MWTKIRGRATRRKWRDSFPTERCERRIIVPRDADTRFSARTLAFIRTKDVEQRYTYTRAFNVGFPTRSKSRQNFAPGVFNSKLREDRGGRIV